MKKIFQGLFFAALVFILAEVSSRILIPSGPAPTQDRTSDHPYIRKNRVPHFKASYSVDGIGDLRGQIPFVINAFGFRGSSMTTKEKQPGTYRIFFLGESTTESLVLSEEQSFPFRVERILSKQFPGKKFEALNAAMSGNIAADSLAIFLYKVIYYEPDLLVIMHAINDLRYGTVPGFDPVERPDYRRNFYFAGFDEKETENLLKSLLKKSYFFQLIRKRIVSRFAPSPVKLRYEALRRKHRSLPFNEPEESRSLPDFIQHLENLIAVAKGRGIRVILMTEPSVYQEDLPEEIQSKLWMGYLEGPKLNLSDSFLFREMHRFNEAVQDLALRQAVEVIDLEREIPKTLEYFFDDVHFTEKGSQRAAQVISNYLLAHPEKIMNS